MSTSNKTESWFRPLNERNFRVGDRIEWDGRDRGTVLGILDEDALAVQYDDPSLGRAMAPAWSKRLQNLGPALDRAQSARSKADLKSSDIWDEPTTPYSLWDGQTIVEQIVGLS